MEAPKLPSIFKARSAKPFEYKPRYYDARKERLEEMKKKYGYGDGGPAAGKNTELSEADFRERMSSQWRAERSKSVSSSNARLFAIIIALFLIAYLIISKI